MNDWRGCAAAVGIAVVALGAGCGERGGDGDPPPGGGLTVDVATKAGVVWGSCVPDDGIEDFIQELWDRDPFLEGVDSHRLAACVAREGGGCDALETCAGIVVDLTGPCTDQCLDSTRYSACDDMVHVQVDCARLGLVCDPLQVKCAPAEPASVACDFMTFEETCEGGRPLYCSDVVQRGPVCAELGLECGVDPAFGAVGCRGTMGECASTVFSASTVHFEGLSCMGANLEVCVNGGRAIRDCAAVGPGFSCQSFGGTFCGLGSECDPYTGRDTTCSGTSVQFCNMGRMETIDCTSLGFTGCTMPFGCTPTGWMP